MQLDGAISGFLPGGVCVGGGGGDNTLPLLKKKNEHNKVGEEKPCVYQANIDTSIRLSYRLLHNITDLMYCLVKY